MEAILSSRNYYSVRTGKNTLGTNLSLPVFLKLFYDFYIEFNSKCYFQEAFGYDCVDAGFIPGKLGSQIDAQIFRKLRKESIWPIEKEYSTRILRRRISEGKALVENSPFLPQKRAVLGDFSSVLNQNRHFLTYF